MKINELPPYSPTAANVSSGAVAPHNQQPELQASDTDPHRLAAVFLAKSGAWDKDKRLTLRYWHGEWWRWTGTHYRKLAYDDVIAELTRIVKADFDDLARARGKLPLRVNKALLGNVLNALNSLVGVSSEIDQPAWLEGKRTTKYIALKNGLIDLEQVVDVNVRSYVYTHSCGFRKL